MPVLADGTGKSTTSGTKSQRNQHRVQGPKVGNLSPPCQAFRTQKSPPVPKHTEGYWLPEPALGGEELGQSTQLHDCLIEPGRVIDEPHRAGAGQ